MVDLSTPRTAPVYSGRAQAARYLCAPLLLLLGVALLTGGRGDRWTAPLGLLLVGLGLAAVAQLVLEPRWARRRPGPRLDRAPTGEPSTVLVRAPWSAPLRWWLTGTLSLPLALWLGAAVLDRRWPWAAVLLAGLVWVVVKAVPRGPALGLYLTPEHLVLHDHGRERVVPWSQVRSVEPVVQTCLRLRDGSAVRFVAVDLAVHPLLACLAIHACLQQPLRRAELGTPRSLAWPEWAGETHGVQS